MAQVDDQLVAKGEFFAVKFATRLGGRRPAEEFWSKLDRRAQTRFAVLFQRLCDVGYLSSPDQWRKVGEAVHEFKRGAYRIFAYRDKDVWYLTNGFKKSTTKRQNEAIKLADRIREEHRTRDASK